MESVHLHTSATDAPLCQTCGRVITPRAKWAKNWSEIKLCSDGCRSQRPGRRTRWPCGPEEPPLASALARSSERNQEAATCSTDVECWTELAVLAVAHDGSGAKVAPTCEDVERRLLEEGRPHWHAEAQASEGDGGETDQPNGHPLYTALHSAPGLRERVRRAARRLVILAPELCAHTAAAPSDSAPAGRVELVQGSKTLQTLDDVSFAKGPIGLRWVAERRQKNASQ